MLLAGIHYSLCGVGSLKRCGRGHQCCTTKVRARTDRCLRFLAHTTAAITATTVTEAATEAATTA